jgi:hypothetical protein
MAPSAESQLREEPYMLPHPCLLLATQLKLEQSPWYTTCLVSKSVSGWHVVAKSLPPVPTTVCHNEGQPLEQIPSAPEHGGLLVLGDGEPVVSPVIDVLGLAMQSERSTM